MTLSFAEIRIDFADGANHSMLCPAPFAKIFRFAFDPTQLLIHLIPSQEGALAIVTDVGAGSGGRGCAFDERRVMRTVKSCGPDAPVAGVKSAMMLRITLATVTKKPGLAGESTK
jgi:hypothetical protein